MDLRTFGGNAAQADVAAALLHYQPFVIDDDRHTGVGYSWLHSHDPTRDHYAKFLFDRRIVSPEVWAKAWDANRRVAAMYDDFVDAIAGFCRDGSYLDIGCNTGYLPVRASLAGIPKSAGLDCDDYSRSFAFLNEVTGSKAQFLSGDYNSS